MKPLGVAGVVCLVLGVAAVLSGLLLAANLHAAAPAGAAQSSRIAPPPASPGPSAIPTSTPPPTAAPAPTPTARSFDALQTEVDWLLQSAGADGAVTLIELRSGESWSAVQPGHWH